jgi:DNA-binding transcriptional ArsR family regulator
MDKIEKLVEIFKALSDPTRLRLVKLLNDCKPGICRTGPCVSMPRQISWGWNYVLFDRLSSWVSAMGTSKSLFLKVRWTSVFSRPRFMPKKLKIADLETHLQDLRDEARAVEEHIAQMKKEK